MPATVRRIGIGIAEDAGKVIESVNGVSGDFIPVCYRRPGIVDKNSVGKLLRLLNTPGRNRHLSMIPWQAGIDEAARGTLP